MLEIFAKKTNRLLKEKTNKKKNNTDRGFLMLAIQYGNRIISSYDMSQRDFTLHDNIIRKRKKNLQEVFENRKNAFFFSLPRALINFTLRFSPHQASSFPVLTRHNTCYNR